MIDDTVYKIALAAYFHDIGKFAERARGKRNGGDEITPAFYPDEEYLNNNAGLYLPFNKEQNRHTHQHALYTAHLIDSLEKILPAKFNKGEWGLDDSFMNLAAGHHHPKTAMQWIIAIADRVSSGFDRDEFEDYNAESGENRKGIKIQDYKKTRLLTIFEGLSTGEEWKEDSLDAYRYRYPLKELSPANIFPLDTPEIRQVDSKQASKDYSDLFFNFIAAIEKLEHKQNIPLWFEHFDSLFMIYASHIPAATVGYVVPDVSLYDHCRTTSALASALYLYHHETGTIDEDNIKNYEPKKFLLVNGDFYGIQDFIFPEGGGTGKASAKLLRGRSFYVSLLSELAADMICRGIGLPVSSVILNAAGKFTILAPNTNKAKETIKETEEHINKWLIDNFYGQASIGISLTEASCNDFVAKNFPLLWEELSKETERNKFSKIDLDIYGGCTEGYLNSFDKELGICAFCGKRPAALKYKDDNACKICHDHIHIGEKLVKNDRMAIADAAADLHDKLQEPIFGKYQLAFTTGKLGDLSRAGTLLKYWDIGIPVDGNIAKDITARFINGYVPKYEEEDLTVDAVNRILSGRKSAKAKDELFDEMKPGVPKTFHYLAKMALNEGTDKFKGIEALGVLKADVDNLGLLFACGMREGRLTISRLATLSRQLNNFFSLFLPHKLKTGERFKNTYTVFAGGDDLFLIGPWNRIIELAKLMNQAFRDYVCENSHITLSTGISVHKPGIPVATIAESSERALDESKSLGRDRITIFGETVIWDKFSELETIKEKLDTWINEETVNNAMLFRFNELIEMARQEKEILKGPVHIEDMECLKWRARFKYTVVRNIGKGLKGDKKTEAIEEVMQAAKWLVEFGGAMKLPLWQIIYNRR
jgi:CRISPR-associated protein Csm1